MSKYCCNIDHKRVVALGGGARTLVISAFFIPLFFLSSSEAYSEDGIKSNDRIYNRGGDIGDVTGIFNSNTSAEGGAAIYNTGKIGNITADFINNEAQARGGAIANGSAGVIGNITGDFIGNISSADGGAISNEGAISAIINSNFINNTVKNVDEYEFLQDDVYGGAIYTKKDLNIIADNGVSIFSGNKVDDDGVIVQNAIYADRGGIFSKEPVITLEAKNYGQIIFDDQIDGNAKGYQLHLKGDKTSEISFNNSIKNAHITLEETNVNVRDGAYISDNKSLDVKSGVLNIANMNSTAINYEKFTVNGSININSVDVDLANNSMGHFSADEYGESNGNIDVKGVNLISDSHGSATKVLFADSSYADTVTYSGASHAYSTIYKYNVGYNPDDGFFTFVRSSGSMNPSDNFNPSVLTTPVSAQSGAYSTQMQTFNYAFQHADNFMSLPIIERIALKESGRYAMTGSAGIYSPLLTRIENAGYWVKPYVSFENIPLKNGPKVNTIAYGSLIGFDSSIKPVKYGFDRVLTGYIGYNGASQNYSGVDTYQNGGLLGGTVTLYRGNFFNATTLSAGASLGESHTMYGKDNFTMLLAGIGNKLGYNFEFKDGKYIIQPSMLMSYTFVNTFDYTNSAGVHIDSDPLHAIQLTPGVKFIMNTKNGWQPYVGINMVWNILNKNKVTANDVRLPEMSIKPYVQYGLGVQKRIKDKFLAFGQAMVSNGGRNGVSLSFGLRWFIGK